MKKYGVEYVYIGEIEELYYNPRGLAGFDEGLGRQLDEVYRNEHVKIYKLSQN